MIRSRYDSGGRRRRWSSGVAVTAVVVGTFSALAAPANAALSAVGDTDPGSLYPTSYTDANGLSLQLCEDGIPLCLAGPTKIQAVHAAGGDAEAFYFHATADSADVAGFTIEAALEAAYLGPGDGQEQTFQRRQATATGMTAGATYTITDPYGTYTCVADTRGRVQASGECRHETIPVPGNFTNALSGPIGPFLTWNTYGSAAGAPPAGYIGDGVTPHLVTGSPTGFNKMRVSGPGIVGTCTDTDGSTVRNCQETDKIILQGKVQPGASAAVSASNWDFGNIAAPTTKTFTYKNTSSDGTSVNITGVAKSAGTSTDYTVGGTCAAGAVAPGASCTVTVTYTPTGTSPDTGSVVISSDTVGIGDRTITLTGKSVGVPFIDTPAAGGALAFGNVGTGTTSAEDVVAIGNSGVGNLSLSSATITGTSASHFTRVGTTNTCATLAPDAGCEVGVRFAPATNGVKTANLRLLFNDGTTLNVPLSGTGAAPSTPGTPTSVTGTAAQGAATINWSPPSVTGSSAITGYAVKAFNGTTQVGTTRNVGSTVRSSTFTGLAANTAYTLQVQAVNGSGAGTPATANVTTPAAPVLPAAPGMSLAAGTYAGTQSVTVTAGAGTTIRYTVGTGTTVPADPTATTGTLYSGPISVASTRTIKVAAFNSAGRSPVVTRTYTISTAATVPVKPAQPTATAGAAGGAVTASLTWVAPATGGSAITGYTIRALKMNASGTVAGTTVFNVASTARSMTFTTLAAGNYKFTVQAKNAIGVSPQSARSVQVAAR